MTTTNDGQSKIGRSEICQFWSELDLNLNRRKSHVLPICLPIHKNSEKIPTHRQINVLSIGWRRYLSDCITLQSKRKFLCWFLKEHSCIWIGTGSDRSHIFWIGNLHCRFWVGTAIINNNSPFLWLIPHHKIETVSPSFHLLFWSRLAFWSPHHLEQCLCQHLDRNRENSEKKRWILQCWNHWLQKRQKYYEIVNGSQPSIRILPFPIVNTIHCRCRFGYRNAFLLIKLSNLTSFNILIFSFHFHNTDCWWRFWTLL